MRRTLTSKPLLFHFFLSSSPIIPSSNFLFCYSYTADDPRRRKGSFSSSSSSSSSLRSHQDEESRAIKVSVWWDIENCSIPTGVNVFRVSQRITSALRTNGIKGPVSITAYGDVLQISRPKQEALISTGVCITHVPNSGKNSADRSLLVDLVYWVSQNPPPAHLFLISSDTDFANVLHRLRMSNYNILLASSVGSSILSSAASIIWHWNGLVRGDSLTGKHFNHPPDGPYGSWYGHHKGPLEEPFADIEPEDCQEPCLEPNPRQIPKALVNRIRQILNLYPDGVSLSDFYRDLRKSNVGMDKNFFGYKKFSQFLLALPNVLKLHYPSAEQKPLVYGVHMKACEVECNSKPSTSKKTSSEQKDSRVSDGQPLLSEEKSETVQPVEVKSKPPIRIQSNGGPEGNPTTSDIDGNRSSPEALQPKLEQERPHGSEEATQLGNAHTEKLASISEYLGTKCPDVEKSSDNFEEDHKKACSGLGFFDRLVRWCKLWKVSGKGPIDDSLINNQTTKSQGIDEYGSDKRGAKKMSSQLESHDIFSKPYFWDDLELFLNTPISFALFSRSRTRDQLVQELQEEGPLILKSLSANHLSRLVDMLISEKKWVEEVSSAYYPFKLSFPNKKSSSSPSNGNRSNGLSSIFSRNISNSYSMICSAGSSFNGTFTTRNPPTLLQLKTWVNKFRNGNGAIGAEDLKKHFEGEFNSKIDCGFYGFTTVENLIQACSQTDSSVDKSSDKDFKRSRREILSDCKKLLRDILEEYPDGFNMGLFKSQFYVRYGYILDYQMLGYAKLVFLLRLMPGLEIKNGLILPAKKVLKKDFMGEMPNCDQESRTEKPADLDEESSAGRDNEQNPPADQDSMWEELGPTYEINGSQNGADSDTHGKSDQEPEWISLEDVSDSESENPVLDSLVQIMDSQYSSKVGKEDMNADSSENLDCFVDCSRSSGLKPLDSPILGADVFVGETDRRRMPKPRENYSFVSNSVNDEKEKLIGSILDSLKKSADSKMQS